MISNADTVLEQVSGRKPLDAGRMANSQKLKNDPRVTLSGPAFFAARVWTNCRNCGTWCGAK